MSTAPEFGEIRPEDTGKRTPKWLSQPALTMTWELLTLLAITLYLFCYGMVPILGGDQLGLVGADEPRYAQVAREMLQAHADECHALHVTVRPKSLRWNDLQNSYRCLSAGAVTPILYGEPWLEKPALYYWRAMSFFKEFGISDWSARLPSASATMAMILLIYLHMRRFRPGGHLDAALLTAASVGILSFARGASTDMQLAAPFSIGMLGWYAWYETGKKFWLFDLYFFGALATLAKGPVAPFMALTIILLFAGLRREWSLIRRTIWIPGVVLYLVITLPWYIEVQRRNPTFYKFFLLEHNLERFASDRYQHHQPIYYYLVVLILALMPWTVLAIRSIVDSIQIAIAEWKVRHQPARYLGNTRAGDAFPEFLVLWAIFPVLFFSFSGSKLPGYILPALPPATILTGDFLYRNRREGLKPWLLVCHAATVAVMTFVLALAPQYMVYEKFVPALRSIAVAGIWAAVAGFGVYFVVNRYGLKHLRTVSLIPVIALLFFLLHMKGWLLDANYSARPLERKIEQAAPNVQTLATYHIKRDMDYGLAFYRNQPLAHYFPERTVTEKVHVVVGVPSQEHILVMRAQDVSQLPDILPGRIYEPLFLYEWQGLAVYRVYATNVK